MDTLHCSVLPSHTLESAKQLVEDLSLSCQAVKVGVCVCVCVCVAR